MIPELLVIEKKVNEISNKIKMTTTQFFKSRTPLKISGVYGIINEANGKIYIGQSKNIHKRLGEHTLDRGSNKKMKYDIDKYGIDKFYCLI